MIKKKKLKLIAEILSIFYCYLDGLMKALVSTVTLSLLINLNFNIKNPILYPIICISAFCWFIIPFIKSLVNFNQFILRRK